MRNEASPIGRLVAGVGGLALVVSVFLGWYTLNLADLLRAAASQLPAELSNQLSAAVATTATVTLTWSGWHAVHTIRFVLLLVGVAVVISSLAPSTPHGHRQGVLVLGGGVLATIMAGYRIASPPGGLGFSFGPVQFPAPPGSATVIGDALRVHAGAWVALLGGVLAILGGWSQLASTPRPATAPTSVHLLAAGDKPPPHW